MFFTTYKSGASDVRIYIGCGRTIGFASEGVGIHSLSETIGPSVILEHAGFYDLSRFLQLESH
ncbi:hypothetical protein [Desulfosporosinus sp. HMP52]|uniref:hypothetical protein n=1 Tax=Desulfosporosinus sp. HMP52 TaxID=1487923 RepID=UPI001FA7FF05|nr:hypothetical protein [Desulfosporosinus sp. HMP52]